MSKTRIFYISGDDVILKNINFNRGNSSSLGGAIFATDGGNCTVINCTFTNNKAAGGGGAIKANENDLTVINSTFENNQARDGGAISSNGNNLNVRNSVFTNNHVFGEGGAIRSSTSGIYKSVIENCEFYSNSVTEGGGGAVCLAETNHMVINSIFSANTAVYGGAIEIPYDEDVELFTECYNIIIGSTFTNNHADLNGGAIDVSEENCTIINSSFAANQAEEYGGAVFTEGANFCLMNSTFEDNRGKYWGGAVCSLAKDCSIMDSTFTNNTSYNGGAVYSEGENCVISGSLFADDYAKINGGAIYSESDAHAINCAFNNCTTDEYSGRDGALCDVICTNCTFDMYFPTISVSPATVKYGVGAVFTVNLNSDATGNIAYEVATKSGSAEIIDGAATFAVSGLNYGLYDVHVSYAGDDRYFAGSADTTLKVNKNSPIASISSVNIVYGNDAIIAVNLAQNVPGNVKITVNGKTQKAKITNGVAIATFTGLNAGTYDVTAAYAGNVNYVAQTKTASLNVAKATPILSVSVSDAVFGGTGRVNVNLASDVPGNVRVTINDVTEKAKITNGKATYTVSGLKAGSYDVKVYYAGNVNYAAQTVMANLNVAKANPIASVSVENINVGDAATVTVQMADNVNGNVRITVNGVTKKVQIVDGVAVLNVTGLKAGTYEVSAVYAGNANFNAQTMTAGLTVSKSSPGLSFTATTKSGKTTVTAKIAQDAPGNVRIIVDGVTVDSAKITNGVATYVISGLTSGSHTIKVAYAGNYKYTAQSRTKTITI